MATAVARVATAGARAPMDAADGAVGFHEINFDVSHLYTYTPHTAACVLPHEHYMPSAPSDRDRPPPSPILPYPARAEQNTFASPLFRTLTTHPPSLLFSLPANPCREYLQSKAREDVPNMLELSFGVSRSNPTPKVFSFLAEDERSRDVVVLVMRALAL